MKSKYVCYQGGSIEIDNINFSFILINEVAKFIIFDLIDSLNITFFYYQISNDPTKF